jgi:DNA-binding transcriptional MerR regulator
MSNPPLKVGDLAERTGVSVRALHYYEEIGLLVPSHRTGSGHRLYGAEDVVRLQQIKSLRALGLRLGEVRECIENRGYSTRKVIEDHLARASEQLALQQQVVARLERLLSLLRRGGEVSTEEFLKTIEVMTMWEKKVTPEQRAEVKARAAELGPEKVREVEQQWLSLIRDLRKEMAEGTDPKSDRVQSLLNRAREVTRTFAGGNTAIETTLREAYREGAGAEFGVDAELREYMRRATG